MQVKKQKLEIFNFALTSLIQILAAYNYKMENNKINAKPQAIYITNYISDFMQTMTQIWPKWTIFEFSQKMRKSFFRL